MALQEWRTAGPRISAQQQRGQDWQPVMPQGRFGGQAVVGTDIAAEAEAEVMGPGSGAGPGLELTRPSV